MHLELSCLSLCPNISSAQEAIANLQMLVPLLRFIGSAGDKRKAKVDLAECRFLYSRRPCSLATDTVKVVLKTGQLLDSLEGCYRSSLEEFIRQQYLRERERQRGETSWTDMHHATGRLMSYFYAVRVFLKARVAFPELFSSFSVDFVPSSGPGDTPDIRKNVDGIVSRLTPDKSIVEMFRKLEPQLQEWQVAVPTPTP